MKKTWLALVLLTACSGQVEPIDPCYEHTAREFTLGEFSCDPATAKTCAFAKDNLPTALDGSERPLSYVCSCNTGHFYACFGRPSFDPPESLPEK